MVIVAIIAVGVLAFAIAAAVIGREAHRLGAQRLEPVYRLPEAVASVSERLDDDAASALTEADVTEIVRLHLNLLQFGGGAAPGPGADASDEVGGGSDAVVDAGDAVQVVYRQARANGFDVSRPHVEQMMDAHMGYLRAIGAVDDVA